MLYRLKVKATHCEFKASTDGLEVYAWLLAMRSLENVAKKASAADTELSEPAALFSA